jgi:predicted neutral ceramidase superfamily lipid hydrolase
LSDTNLLSYAAASATIRSATVSRAAFNAEPTASQLLPGAATAAFLAVVADGGATAAAARVLKILLAWLMLSELLLLMLVKLLLLRQVRLLLLLARLLSLLLELQLLLA